MAFTWVPDDAHAGDDVESAITIESAVGGKTPPLNNTNALNFWLMMPEVSQNKIRPSPSTPGEVTKA